MRVCDLGTGLTMLHRATKKLREAWSNAREQWDDKTSSDFEQEHLQPLLAQLTLTAAAIHRLNEVVQRAEQACGDDRET
ncbi:MAG: hypothetical protein J5I93_16040 [Pirellulaceae bacterium]|nr:hypothetical protein [Pirellulaceae bacterium]